VSLKTASDVDEFVENCSPKEISASACVLGLFATSDAAGKMTLTSVVILDVY